MRYVLVNGAFVIRGGGLDTAAFPGRPVRRTVLLMSRPRQEFKNSLSAASE
jgi:hypothetical protein